MAKLILTWNTVCDERVCPICKALEGYTWTFDTSRGEHLGNELVHPQFGVVWNVQSGSQAHGHRRYNCRCYISNELDLSDLLKKTERLYNEILASVGK